MSAETAFSRTLCRSKVTIVRPPTPRDCRSHIESRAKLPARSSAAPPRTSANGWRRRGLAKFRSRKASPVHYEQSLYVDDTVVSITSVFLEGALAAEGSERRRVLTVGRAATR